jgi:plastocyanin
MIITPMRRRGLGTAAIVGVVVVVLVAAAAAYLYLPRGGTNTNSSTSTSSTSSSTFSAQTSTSSSSQPTIAIVIVPLGVGSDQTLNFQPANLKVMVGVNSTVRWLFQDSVPHNVMSSSVPSGAQSFSSSSVMYQGSNFTVTLTVPGTYKYYCSIHPTYMIGQIVVLAQA